MVADELWNKCKTKVEANKNKVARGFKIYNLKVSYLAFSISDTMRMPPRPDEAGPELLTLRAGMGEAGSHGEMKRIENGPGGDGV